MKSTIQLWYSNSSLCMKNCKTCGDFYYKNPTKIVFVQLYNIQFLFSLSGIKRKIYYNRQYSRFSVLYPIQQLLISFIFIIYFPILLYVSCRSLSFFKLEIPEEWVIILHISVKRKMPKYSTLCSALL